MSGIGAIGAAPPAPAPVGGRAAAIGSPPPAAAPEGVREAAKAFEAMFLSKVVEEMLAGTSLAESNPIYAGMMVDGLGSQLAEAGGIGLAALLERQLGGER